MKSDLVIISISDFTLLVSKWWPKCRIIWAYHASTGLRIGLHGHVNCEMKKAGLPDIFGTQNSMSTDSPSLPMGKGNSHIGQLGGRSYDVHYLGAHDCDRSTVKRSLGS